MSRRGENVARRWAGLAAVAMLLALCFILLGVQMTAAQESPTEQAAVQAEPAGPDALAMGASPVWAAGPQQVNPGFTVDLVYDAVWGLVEPGDAIVVSRPSDGAYGAAEADGVGFFWTPLWQGNGQPADVVGGGAIEVYVNGALAASLNPRNVTGGIDVLTDQVVGTIVGDTGGTLVTLTVGAEGQPPGGSAPQQTVTTNGSGSFAAAFASVNLGANGLVAVEYPRDGHTVRTYLYPSPRVFLAQNLDYVQGYADPGQQVDVTVYEGAGPAVRWSASANAGWPHGWYDIWAPYPSHTQVGDVVQVDLGGGQILTTTVVAMSVTGVDPVLNQVVGIAPPGALVTIGMWQLAGYAQATATADPSGDFTASFAAADLRPRDEFRVSVSDGEGDESQLLSGAPYIDGLIDGISGMGCVYWRVDGPSLPVTLTLQTATDVYTRTGVTSSPGNGSAPYCAVIRDPGGTPLSFVPGDIVTVKSPTWQGSLEIADITWAEDTAADQVSGNAPPGEVEVTARQWHFDQYPIHGSAVGAATAGPTFVATLSSFDLRDGGYVEVGHYDPTSDFVTHPNGFTTLATHYFEVGIYGIVTGAPPSRDEMVTAALYDASGVELASTNDDWDGDPWRFELFFGDETRIEPGQWVTVTSESGWTAGLQVPELTVNADEDTDLIWGEGPKSLLFVSVGWDQLFHQFAPADGFVVDTAFWGYDLVKSEYVVARYQARNGNRVSQSQEWPRMGVNYGLDEATGFYNVGYTFWITVTDSVGSPKAHATTTTTPAGTGPDGAWSNGFWVQTDDWSDPALDIRPGDWVLYRADDGYTNSVLVGTITARLDAAANTAAGTITAPGFVEPLGGFAGFWGSFWEQFTVDPNGGSYLVDFSPYDLQPGDEVSVGYGEPDGDTVRNVFWVPRGQVYLPLVLRNYSP
jgi:hypothetical protein